MNSKPFLFVLLWPSLSLAETIELDCVQNLPNGESINVAMTVDFESNLITDQNDYWKGSWRITSSDERFITAEQFQTYWKKDDTITENGDRRRVLTLDRFSGRAGSPDSDGFQGFERKCATVEKRF